MQSLPVPGVKTVESESKTLGVPGHWSGGEMWPNGGETPHTEPATVPSPATTRPETATLLTWDTGSPGLCLLLMKMFTVELAENLFVTSLHPPRPHTSYLHCTLYLCKIYHMVNRL